MSARIAMVHQPWNPAVPPVDVGSIAIWTYETANRLARTASVTAFAKRVAGLPREHTFAGVRYRRVSAWPSPYTRHGRFISMFNKHGDRPKFAQPGFFSRYAGRIASQIHVEEFEVAHVHNMVTFPTAIRAASENTRIVLHMHCEWLSNLPRDMTAELVRPVDQLVACSEYLANTVNAHLRDERKKCIALPNGVDTAHFAPADSGPGRDGAPPEIVFVGRITPEKGLHTLISAFDRVQEGCPEARLRIVGPYSPTPRGFITEVARDPLVAGLARWYESDYLATLKQMAGERCGGSILFHGGVPHSQLPAIYRNATVLANPSISESFGMSLIEALACGCPVVATRIGGMTEIVDDGEVGCLVDVENRDALAEALLSILCDPSRRMAMGRNARIVAEERYSWESITDHLRAIYDNLLR